MRWITKLSCDVKLCQELQCRKLLKSDNYSSTYSQQYEWVFFLKHGVHICFSVKYHFQQSTINTINTNTKLTLNAKNTRTLSEWQLYLYSVHTYQNPIACLVARESIHRNCPPPNVVSKCTKWGPKCGAQSAFGEWEIALLSKETPEQKCPGDHHGRSLVDHSERTGWKPNFQTYRYI